MTVVYTADSAQAQAVLDLVAWFDDNASSVHHALIMAAQRNEADSASIEGEAPAAARILRQSAISWRTHAEEVLALSQGLGDTRAIDDNPF